MIQDVASRDRCSQVEAVVCRTATEHATHPPTAHAHTAATGPSAVTAATAWAAATTWASATPWASATTWATVAALPAASRPLAYRTEAEGFRKPEVHRILSRTAA